MTLTETWHRFARWGAAAGMEVKIMGIALGIVCVISGATAVSTWISLNRVGRRHLQSTSVWIASALREGGLEMFLTEDVVRLQEFLGRVVRDNDAIRYAFFIGPEGRIVASTFPNTSAELLRANAPQGSVQHVRALDTEEGIVWDVAMPLLAGRAGTLRVGLSERLLQHDLRVSLALQIAFILALSLVAALTALRLTRILTRRVQGLVEVTEAVGRGNFDVRPPVTWMDEIGRLGRSFNDMIDRLQQANEELRRKEQARVQLLNRVMTAQEEERKRVARELHDEMGQAITSLMVGLRVAAEARDMNEVTQRLADIRATADQTLAGVKHLAWELRPAILDDLGLVAAMQRYAEHCRQRYGFEVDWQMNLDTQRLPAEVETALYRILQEALTNVARHAGATHVGVVLERRDGEVIAIVEDDGCGFDATQMRTRSPGQALGIFGMEERAALLNGTLVIESEAGQGTTVFVRVPTPEPL